MREILSAVFASVGVQPNLLQEVSQTQTVLALANAGLGAALEPRSAMPMQVSNSSDRLIDLPERFNSAIYPNTAQDRNSPHSQRVKDVVIEALSNAPRAAGPALRQE